MNAVLDHPYLLFVATAVAQWVAAYAGDVIRRHRTVPAEDKRADFDLIRTATLTLLGLIIGFTFQMAISRYDQRKTYEREEANAIGTQYLRADLLPAEDADKVRASWAKYLQQRVLFYTVDDKASLAQVDSETTNLENAMWQTVSRAANANPTQPIALAVAGMNDVLNARGYPGGVVESHPAGGLGADGTDCDRGQPDTWLRRKANGFAFAPGFAGRDIDRDVSHRRHRRPARGCYPRSAG